MWKKIISSQIVECKNTDTISSDWLLSCDESVKASWNTKQHVKAYNYIHYDTIVTLNKDALILSNNHWYFEILLQFKINVLDFNIF